MTGREWIFVFILIGIAVVISVLLVSSLDLHEHDAIAIVAMVGAIASISNSMLIQRNRRRFEDQLRPSNGERIADLVESIADRSMRHETKLDAVEVEVREGRDDVAELGEKLDRHIETAQPMLDFVAELMPKGGK